MDDAGTQHARETKARLRAEALARRDALSTEYRIEAALRLAECCADVPFAPGGIVSGFLPIRSEIDARPLMYGLRAHGAKLCLPAVLDRQTIVFRAFEREDSLEPAGFGTLAPGPDAMVLDPETLLVPLSVFDNRGNRIGYGAGHYDRAIARLHAQGLVPRLIGLAFDCQQVDAVPAESHDVPLDGIITESGLRWFAAAGNGRP